MKTTTEEKNHWERSVLAVSYLLWSLGWGWLLAEAFTGGPQ